MLEELGIVGINWRWHGSENLSRFTLSKSKERVRRLRDFAHRADLSELAYLATCNRVEVIFAHNSTSADEAERDDVRPWAFEMLTGQTPAPGEAERALKAWHGEGACEHLMLIASGLDSAAVGEAEIVGQVRACRDDAANLGLIGPRLELLFDEALRVAAQVRGATRIGHGSVSLAEVAVVRLRERLKHTPGAVALVGVSSMTERAAQSLLRDSVPLIFVNRTVSKARAAARHYSAAALSLADFLRDPPPVEAVLSSVGAPEPLLMEPTLERLAAKTPSGEAPLLIDMAVTENIDSGACRKLGLPRVGMDEIVREAQINREARLLEVAQARELVDEALPRLRDRFAERVYGPLFGALQNRYLHTAREGMRRLLKKDIKGLGNTERQAIETWAEVLARRFAHIPTLGLRGLLHHGPDGSLDAFLQGLDAEFADELRQALDRPPRHTPNRRPSHASHGDRGNGPDAVPGLGGSHDEAGRDAVGQGAAR